MACHRFTIQKEEMLFIETIAVSKEIELVTLNRRLPSIMDIQESI